MTNTMNTETVLTDVAEMYVEAKRAAEEADANLKAARELVLSLVQDDATTSDGTRVAVVMQRRESYNFELLSAALTPQMLELVTKRSIMADQVRSAVELGLIRDDVAGAALSVAEVHTVRVYPTI